MIKTFIATVSIALFMLVCLASSVSAGIYGDDNGYSDRGSPYGDYQKEQCLRVCYRSAPRCGYGWFTRLVGSCYTCCRIRQKYIPYEDDQMNMEQDHDMNMDEKPVTENMN